MSTTESTTTTNVVSDTNSPKIDSCILQPTSDHQLNANLSTFMKLLITGMKDGTIPVKNAARLQNLTVNDIIELAKKASPVQDINNYITENGTNIIEMIDSYSIIRDTKFVTTGFIPFKVITRREDDPSDPTGITKIEVPYIKCTLPYDIINKDRIVQIYITTKNDDNDNLIQNDVIFEYDIQIDSQDPRAPYTIETRAKKIEIGKTIEYNVNTYPQDPKLWGIWSDEKFIKVTYLVDVNWVSIPQPELPNLTVPNVATMTSTVIQPMNYGLTQLTPTSQPIESVNVEFNRTNIVTEDESSALVKLDDQTIQRQNIPTWMILEDPTTATKFDEYLNWFKSASYVLQQQTGSFTWTPAPDEIESSMIHIVPVDRIINQFTFDLMTESFIKWGSSLGFKDTVSKIVEVTHSNIINLRYSTSFEPYGKINGTETQYGLLIKLNAGEQYPFINVDISRVPSRIVEILSSETEALNYIKRLNAPAKIIEELLDWVEPLKSLNYISVDQIPSRIVNFLDSIEIVNNNVVSKIDDPSWVVSINPNQVPTHITNSKFEDDNIRGIFDKIGTKIINELDSEEIIFNEYVLNRTIPKYIIEEIISETDKFNPINIYDPALEQLKLFSSLYLNKKDLKLGKLFSYDPARVINLQSTIPMKMEVSSGSIYYIQDLYNMKIISSLSTEELVPLVTAEGRQQRSEYEFVAEQNQRVFDVAHNPDLVTVFRQGFKLSHGDYYSNGSKIILKSPANAGEILNVISERKYVFSNTVTKEELTNALSKLKTDKPIITYQGICYEQTTGEIKIHNYDPTAVYTVAIRYEGNYRDDIKWAKRNNIIVVDIPEIENVARRTLSVVIYAHTSGKLQSDPTEALINIKNLFDVTTVNGSVTTPTYRLIYGAVPTEWYGLENTHFRFDDLKTPGSTFSDMVAIPATSTTPAIPARIGILPNKWYQTKLVHENKFRGTYLDSTIGLENLSGIKLDIESSNGNETVFGVEYSGYSQKQIEDAFAKGTLYFIVDASTAPNDSNYQVPNGPGYANLRYSYRQALEYTSKLNLLPRTEKVSNDPASRNTWYLEHTDGLVGRNIHSAIIVDFDLLVDYDFDSRAIIDEASTTPNLTETKFELEEIKYQVQDNIPFLMGTINNPKIPHLTNPYINIGSKVSMQTGNPNLDDPQKGNILVNNIYAERIFSGLHTDLSPKDNFADTKLIMDNSKRYKRFFPFSPGTLYETNFKKDFFMLNEEDLNPANPNHDKSIISMTRFYSDLDYVTDNPSYSVRVKEMLTVPCASDTFKALYQIPSEDYNVGSAYQSNFAMVHYGGSANYVINTSGTTSKVIEHKLSYQKIYISGSENIISGKVPLSNLQATDGYHVITGDVVSKRIPTWWDVVLRPSVRSARGTSLREIWYLIRDNIGLTDQRWLNITDGILRKPMAVEDTNLRGNIHRDYEIINVPDKSQILLMGGETYGPTKKLVTGATVNGEYLNSISTQGKYYANALRNAYVRRYGEQGEWRYRSVPDGKGGYVNERYWHDLGGWREKTDIIGIDYGWENGEPYVEYAWADHFYYWTTDAYGRRYSYESGINFYLHRVSRETIINKDIFHIDLVALDNYRPGDNDLYPDFITKITDTTFRKIYDHETDLTKSINTLTSSPNYYDRPNFTDVIYESGSWWLIIKPAYSKQSHLYKMKTTWSLSNNVLGGVNVTNFEFKDKRNLGTNNSGVVVDSNYAKWSLVPDISGMVRGDGPMLFKHTELAPLLSGAETIEPGIYYFDTWDGWLYKKAEQVGSNQVPVSSMLFGIHEVSGVRNPYIIQIDPDRYIEDKIDIVGSRFFIIMYLDSFLVNITKEEFLLFKEEIFHINSGVSTSNPKKEITIYNNIANMKIRTILPDGDDYKSNSAQILMERISTQAGRPATDFVFRITNNNINPLEIDSIRFQTI